MLGNCANCLLGAPVLLTMLVTVWALLSWGWRWNPSFNHPLPLAPQGQHPSLCCNAGRTYKDRWSCITPMQICEQNQLLWPFFLHCCSMTCTSCQENGGKELNAMAYGSAFSAWCRFFLPDSSKMVIHGTRCTFLSAFCSLKSQWWQTQSPGQLLCTLPQV